MIEDKLQIERLLAQLTDFIAKEMHLSTVAAAGAVCMSKIANELSSGKVPQSMTLDDLSKQLLEDVTMAV